MLPERRTRRAGPDIKSGLFLGETAALASYGRQSEDDKLEKTALRIRARAIRRCGELLKEYDGRPDNAAKQSDGTGTLISKRDAAREAGLSKRQQDTAVRVANVPEADFEEQVESADGLMFVCASRSNKRCLPLGQMDSLCRSSCKNFRWSLELSSRPNPRTEAPIDC